MIMGLLLTQPKRKLLKIIGQFSFSTLLLFCNCYSLICIVPLNIRSELFCANLISNSKAQPLAVPQTADKPTIFRWVFVIHIKFLIFVDKKCKSLLQRIFAIFFMFCTAAVSKHCSETLSFPRIRQ